MLRIFCGKKMFMAILIFCLLASILPYPPVNAANLTVTVDASSSVGQFYNVLGAKCIWDLRQFDNAHVGSEPDGFIKQWYPYVDYLIMMIFTGGKRAFNNGNYQGLTAYNNWYTEDAYGNPRYDFTIPVEVLNNVVRGGVKPMVVIGQMPNALSTNPSDYGDGEQWGNRYPPKDWTKYYNYMKAFAHALVVNFGVNEVKTWKFRMYTEPENPSWWQGTTDQMLKMYDYTEAALASEIGENNLFFSLGNLYSGVGNFDNYLNHFANGTNYYTGSTGTKCNSLSYSQYYGAVNYENFDDILNQLQSKANQYPSLNINEFGVGEGGFLSGYDGKMMQMAAGITEEFGSGLAREFDLGNGATKGYFANWEYLTDINNWDVNSYSKPFLETPASNAGRMISMLMSGQRISSSLSGSPSNGNLVGQFASADAPNNKIYVLVYNHHSSQGDTGTENVTVNLNNIAAVSGNSVTIKHWRVDHNTSNFATTWLADSASFVRIPRYWGANTGNSGSKYDTAIQIFLNDADKAYYLSRKPYYDTIDHLTTCESDANVTVVNNSIGKSLVMPHHSVSLLEISNVKSTAPPTGLLFSDNFNDNSLDAAWTTKGGTWSESGQILSQTSSANGDPKKAIISNSGINFPTSNITIAAKVRVDSWTDGDYARAGVSLFSNTGDGYGYNLLFHNNHSTVQFLDDWVAWGPSYTFNWTNGTWYWFKLKMESGTLYGKVWQDGATEPANWPYSWVKSGRSGYPALNGGSASSGSGTCTISFDDLTITGAATATPAPTATPTPTVTPTPTSTPGGNLANNPGFEADGAATQNPTGWSTSGTDSDADYTEGPSGGGSPHSGAYHLVHWKSTSYQVYTYQTKTGLTNGLYTLKAWIKNDFGGLGTAYMEAKDFGGTSVTYNIPTTSVWMQISIANINVTNGQCTIGFYSNSPATKWYLVDDVEFYKQ